MNLQLTFEDGPLPAQTALEPIMAELAKRKVKAAFFVRVNPGRTGAPERSRTTMSPGCFPPTSAP